MIELPPARLRMAASTPMDLPRLVMRRAAGVALAVLAAALLLGLWRMQDDIDNEVDAAMALAALVAQLGQMGQIGRTGQLDPIDDSAALDALRAAQHAHPLRHLELQVQDSAGRVLLGPQSEPQPPTPLAMLLAMHRWLDGAPDGRRVQWSVARHSGAVWQVSLAASHDSERREAMTSLIGMLALLVACVAGLLLAMHWNVRRALAPLGRLLEAIAGIEAQRPQAVSALPPMPIRELESVAAALRHLGAALAAAEAGRRLLSQQVLTLQEDERSRLARELHDEFGQRLTALRVDATWLARRVADQPALLAVVQGMSSHCEQVQQDIRALLARLQPFGASGTDAQGESLLALTALLQALVSSWVNPGRDPAGATLSLNLNWLDAHGRIRPWPSDEQAQHLCLPRPLVLALYRISQEALTNVARHAQARTAQLTLALVGDLQPGAPVQIDWCVADDGHGLPDADAAVRRGNGLAGLRERVWAQGASLQVQPTRPGAARPGLQLQARFQARWLAP